MEVSQASLTADNEGKRNEGSYKAPFHILRKQTVKWDSGLPSVRAVFEIDSLVEFVAAGGRHKLHQ